MTTPGIPHTISRASFETNHWVNITVTGSNPTLYYEYRLLMGRNITGYTDPYFDYIWTGDIINGSFAGSVNPVVVSLPLTISYYPYDEFTYNGSFIVREYYLSNHTAKGVSHTMWFSFNLTAPASSATYFLSITDALPTYLDLYGGDALTQGCSYNITSIKKGSGVSASYIDIPLYWYITSNGSSRNLIAWAVKNIHYQPDNTSSSVAFGTVSMDWIQDLKNLVDLGLIQYFSSYYVYIGVKTSGSFSTSNIHWTADDTVMPMNFSIGWPYTTLSHLIEYDAGWGAGDKFVGVMVYFETVPSIYQKNGWTPGHIPSSNVGLALDSFGMLLGLPFFSILIAFMVVAICAMIPWRLAIKYDFEMPSFIYGFAVFAGMILNLVLGIIAIWMFALFALVVAFILFTTYREQISGTLGFATGVPWEARNTEEAAPYRERLAAAHASRIGLFNKAREAGVLGVRQTKALYAREAKNASRVSALAVRTGRRVAAGRTEKDIRFPSRVSAHKRLPTYPTKTKKYISPYPGRSTYPPVYKHTPSYADVTGKRVSAGLKKRREWWSDRPMKKMQRQVWKNANKGKGRITYIRPKKNKSHQKGKPMKFHRNGRIMNGGR